MKGDAFIRQVSAKPPFSKMRPGVAAFFKDYLSNEKVIAFGDRFVLNTHFPPYPSRAFDNLAEHFDRLGDTEERCLFSVTLAVTNRCTYNCWHCYNVGRSQEDIPLARMKELVGELQDLQTVMVTLSGGEPLLRDDLEEIAGAFDETTCLVLNTTGAGLTPERASALLASGVFAAGMSLDSTCPEEHDRMRGRKGAFRTALQGLELASEAGLYPYVIALATREFLKADPFRSFVSFAAKAGAREVHLLEPSATGKLAGASDVLLTPSERQQILSYQREIARREDLPILSSFTYLESPDAFGCGAGLTHLYIDGSGEVCPCNLVPMSFGNITGEPLRDILDRMAQRFTRPTTACVGHVLAGHIPDGPLPTPPEVSAEICREHLPLRHAVPRFFQILAESQDVGREELRTAYDEVHGHYDAFWLSEAAGPIEDLIGRLELSSKKRILEAGCGTGFATVLIAQRIPGSARVLAVDLSEGMLGEARKRLQAKGLGNVQLVAADALEVLDASGPFDLVFSSWVLGYIPLKPFFETTSRALTRDGQLAFVVHKENSPREPMEIFNELVAADPSVLLKRVAFDFPRDVDHVRDELHSAGLQVRHLREGRIVFRCDTPEQALEHLLKSGAGTAFYDALDPKRRASMEQRFVTRLAERHEGATHFEVIHDYVSCIAGKSTAEREARAEG